MCECTIACVVLPDEGVSEAERSSTKFALASEFQRKRIPLARSPLQSARLAEPNHCLPLLGWAWVLGFHVLAKVATGQANSGRLLVQEHADVTATDHNFCDCMPNGAEEEEVE